jgi:hypothetical protein
LRPKSEADADLLNKLEKLSTVVPLDDYLHLTDLPFKMTPEVMLNLAYWAQSQGSYQEAEEAIFRAHKVRISDDTIRQVANHIGGIVYQEDCRQAEKAFARLDSSKLKFAKQKKKGILYVEADGAALNTRLKNEEGSTWRENKLGIVFSSDNIYTWTNKHGEKERQINKREYITYIVSFT